MLTTKRSRGYLVYFSILAFLIVCLVSTGTNLLAGGFIIGMIGALIIIGLMFKAMQFIDGGK